MEQKKAAEEKTRYKVFPCTKKPRGKIKNISLSSLLCHLRPDRRGPRQPLLAHGQLQERLEPYRRVLDARILLEPPPRRQLPPRVVLHDLVVRTDDVAGRGEGRAGLLVLPVFPPSVDVRVDQDGDVERERLRDDARGGVVAVGREEDLGALDFFEEIAPGGFGGLEAD